MSDSTEITPAGSEELEPVVDVNEPRPGGEPGATIITAETDMRALIGTALWSWFVFFIPVYTHYRKIKCQEVTVRGSTLTVKTGRFSRKYNNIELYRVKDITATDSAVSSGRIRIVNSDGSIHWVNNLRSPNEFALFLRSLINQDRAQRNVKTKESL